MSVMMESVSILLSTFLILLPTHAFGGEPSLTYIWPLPSQLSSGNQTVVIDPALSLSVSGDGGSSQIVKEAFDRYKKIIFLNPSKSKTQSSGSDVATLKVIVHSDNQELQLGVDESYTLIVRTEDNKSGVGQAQIEANTVYGALRGFETFSQLCTFDYETKSVHVIRAPWYIKDEPRFAYRGLMLDTSRHYQPIDVIKQIIESMSYAKLNVLHWHIIDEQSFPLEIPSYPKLWKGAYSKWERYSVEDATEIVRFAGMRDMVTGPFGNTFLYGLDSRSNYCEGGINVMAEVDVPGHAESWGVGYPDLWPSSTCREPLDVAKNSTFDVIAGILTEIRKIFPFELFHLGGDEVDTTCWNKTRHVKKWLKENKMTPKEAYQYFVIRAQEIAISRNWTPVNWEETFNAFPKKLNPKTVVHNWLGPGVCPRAVAKGFRCIFSNQGVWYLDHLDVPWYDVYTAEPLEGIHEASEVKLVLGGEVCMWGETADASDVQQTIWPRAAAAAERLWSSRESTSSGNITITALPRLQHFRCLLNRRGVPAAPVTNYYARLAPVTPGSCYDQ